MFLLFLFLLIFVDDFFHSIIAITAVILIGVIIGIFIMI